MAMSGHVYTSAALPPGKNDATYWTGGWVDPRVGLDYLEKRNMFSVSAIELPIIQLII